MNDKFDIDLQDTDILNISINDSITLGVDLSDDVTNTGTKNYKELTNKPKINNIELIDNKTLDELNIQQKGNYANKRVTNLEIDNLFN